MINNEWSIYIYITLIRICDLTMKSLSMTQYTEYHKLKDIEFLKLIKRLEPIGPTIVLSVSLEVLSSFKGCCWCNIFPQFLRRKSWEQKLVFSGIFSIINVNTLNFKLMRNLLAPIFKIRTNCDVKHKILTRRKYFVKITIIIHGLKIYKGKKNHDFIGMLSV